MQNFADLGLAETLLRALNREGYETPTPIQAQAIPYLLAGRDLLGIAQTGTGKTAAFALPILHRFLDAPRRPAPFTARALVLAPTRELAAQIAQSFKAYGQCARFSVGVIVGGVGHGPQIELLSRGLDVLVATPGRLLDHLASGRLKLGSTEVVVLDEADHMLDLGFIVPIRQIVARLPKTRQNLFFSATMPKEISGLAAEMLHDPARVTVTPVATTAERIAQHVILCDQVAKRDHLVEALRAKEVTRAIVFTRTKRDADRVAGHLEAAGVTAAAIHGNKSQSQRQRALKDFRDGRVLALVATDIAARGIDVDGITHVVNFHLPETPEAYVHRIGRTARAGASGRALSLCDNGEQQLLRAIEKLTRQQIPATDKRTSAGAQDEAATQARRGQRGRRPPQAAGDPRKTQGRSSHGHGQHAQGHGQGHGHAHAPQGEAGRGGAQRPAGQQQRPRRPARRAETQG
jgi:ATP-dependent RNA helicase RhlE